VVKSLRVRIFKDEEFARRARKEKISDETLREIVAAAERGIVAARLGGELLKLRIARPGAGKSGGYRSIIAFRHKDKAFYIHLFSKNDTDNIYEGELADLKAYGRILLSLTDPQLRVAIDADKLMEI